MAYSLLTIRSMCCYQSSQNEVPIIFDQLTNGEFHFLSINGQYLKKYYPYIKKILEDGTPEKIGSIILVSQS
jgi:hypothetical protein